MNGGSNMHIERGKKFWLKKKKRIRILNAKNERVKIIHKNSKNHWIHIFFSSKIHEESRSSYFNALR